MKICLSLALISVLTFVGAAGYLFKSSASSRTSTVTDEMALPQLGLTFENLQMKVKCNTRAYLVDKDPNGTNVRAKPDKNSGILRTLKSQDAIVVGISGSSNGWFEISSAETAGGETDKTIYEGRGWIHSSLIGLDVANADPKLYAEPRKRSRVLKNLIPDSTEIKPMACKDDWMQVRSGKLTGWISREAQCSNPLTTCS